MGAMAPSSRTIRSVVAAAESEVHQLVAVLGHGVVNDPDRPVLCADDLGLTRGDGCFDATRVVTDPDGTSLIDHLETHLDRFARSAAGLEIPFDSEAWRSLVADAAASWTQPGEAVLRVMLTRGREAAPGDPVTGLLTIAPIRESALAGRSGISVTTLDRGHAADMFTEISWLLGGIKTLSYAINVAAVREAKRRGVDDALFISSDGFALEGPRAALLWRTGDRLATTPIDGTGILASITQAVVFERAAAEGVSVSYQLITVDDLTSSDGAWLLSSGRLVAPILQLDDVQLVSDPAFTERVWAWATGHG
jgi:4-amino-4-deoxychorismate lyase